MRITLIVLLIIALLVMGYFRERYLLVFDPDTIFSFIKKYPRTAITNYKNELKNFIGFDLSPKLTSSILFSLFFATDVSIISHLLIREKSFTRLVILLYVIYMIICFILIVLGNVGLNYRLSIGLSHYLEDLFLSPFILMFLIPVMLFRKNNSL